MPSSNKVEHMKKIGALGGRVVADRVRGSDYYRELGKRGGKATSKKLEDENFREEFSNKIRRSKE